MKKVFKNPIIMFILGALIFSSGTVFAYSLIASDVSFTSKDSSWEVKNAKEAIDDLHKKVNCNNDMIGTTWDYNYSGQEILFVTPCKGTYKLETWGAQGGTALLLNGSVSDALGGYGGYAVGKYALKNRYKLYINVGGKGESCATPCTGGYNGGGENTSTGQDGYANISASKGSGGGATHIATTSGLLKNLENEKDKIIMVAGGGGGALYYNNSNQYVHKGSGGHGGGYMGHDSYARYRKHTDSTINCSFVGGNEQSNRFGLGAPDGGGGGYYGGGNCYGSGGGSGYIGNSSLTNKKMVMYASDNKYISNEENKKTEITTNVSENPTSDYAKMGNGYARITLISID